MCVCVSILILVIRHANRIFSASYSIIICVWPVRLYSIYPHYLINDTIFGEKITEYKMRVLIFFTTFVYNTS